MTLQASVALVTVVRATVLPCVKVCQLQVLLPSMAGRFTLLAETRVYTCYMQHLLQAVCKAALVNTCTLLQCAGVIKMFVLMTVSHCAGVGP